MRMIIASILVMMISCLGSSVQAEQDSFKRLLTAKSLRCVLGYGYSADWLEGAPKLEKSRFTKDGSPTFFDSINIEKQSARMIANQGAIDVLVLVSPSGLTFIEETASGNYTFTTVFPDYKKGSSDEYICVHSRHLAWGTLGPPFPSQFHGTCKIWQ
jgi:hypothetical protein